MNERLVRRLWLGGPWPTGAPQDADGVPLRVVYPGRPGHGAGPDLLDAIVALPDGQLLHGDVELHVRASDWRAHGHDGDRRYERVVLHVVWRDDRSAAPDRAPVGPPGARLVELSALPEATLFARLSAPCRVEEPYHAWLGRLPPDERAGLVEQLGDERLAARALRIGADLHALGPAAALHRALGDALGYAHNRAAFAALSDVAGPDALRALAAAGPADAAEVVTAHLFAWAGLLDEGPVARLAAADGRALAERYRAIVGRPPPDRLAPGAWETVGVRPANRAPRRLAALAALVARTRADGLEAAVLDALAGGEPRLALRRLLALVGVAADGGYWSWHHDFGRRLPGAPLAPLGAARAGAILANAVLPFALAWADARADERLAGAAWALFRLAPGGGPNWILAEMRPLLAGTSLASARREQGAIELYRRCCEERRCATCPTGSVATRVADRAVASRPPGRP